MTYAEFKNSIETMYKSVFPSSACDISIGPLGGDSIYVTYYLAGDQSEFPNRIALNDLFDITFCIFQDNVRYGDGVKLTDDTEMPEALVLDVNHKSIKTAPENQYMAYGSVSLPFRKTKGTPDKILSTLQRYAEITKQTLTELYELEKLPTNQHPEVIEFVKGKLGLTESKQVNNMKIKYSKTYDKYQVITPDGRVLEEFDTEKEATDWASEQKDFVVKKEDVEYISKDELDKIPADYKTTVGDTIKYSWEDKEMLRKKYKDLGYDETDPMILARDDKAGTVLKPVKVKKEGKVTTASSREEDVMKESKSRKVEFKAVDVPIEQFDKEFETEYGFLYDNRDNVAGYTEALDEFDYLIKNDENFKAFVKEFVKYHGDYISSDREAVAFMFALEKYMLDECKDIEIKKEAMNGLMSENSTAQRLYDEFVEFEKLDTEKWNNAKSQEERDAMAMPFVRKYYKEHKEAIDDNWDDFMELLEYWNFHTEHKLFNKVVDEFLGENKKVKTESIQSVADIFNKIRGVRQDIEANNGKLDYNFYEKTSEIEEDMMRLSPEEREIAKVAYNELNNLYSHYDKDDDESEKESPRADDAGMVREAVEQSEDTAMTAPIKNHAHCDECLEDFEYEFDPKNEVSNDIEIHQKGNGYAYYAECPNCGNLIEVPAEELDLVVTNVDDITRDGFYMEVMDRHTARKCWYEVWRSGDDWEFDFNQFTFHLDNDNDVIAKMFQEELLDYSEDVWSFASDIIEEEKLDELEEVKKPIDERAKKLRELKARKTNKDID